LFTGATRGRYCRTASDISLLAHELARLMTEVAVRETFGNIFLFIIRTNCRKHFVLLIDIHFHIIYRENETL